MISYVIQDIKKVMIYLPAGAVVLAIAVAVCWFWKRVYGEACAGTNSKITDIFFQGLLVSYLFIILCITLFSRENGSRVGLDIFPFSTMGHGMKNDTYVVENVLLFIPLGLLTAVSCPKTRQFRQCIKAGMMVSLFIEISQMILERGYIQTDDVLMNVLGMMCGCLVYRIVKKILRKR